MSEGEKIEEPSGAGEELAVGLALGKSRRRRASRSAAPTAEDVFLATESRKLELEIHHLRLGHFDKLLTVGLKLLTVLVGVTLAGAIAVMAWQAHEDHGLVIDAFSVPPDLARDGLSGQVVAVRFLDKLQAMQTATQSDRPANTFTNNWGDEIKLEIPETGLTLGEFDKLLREKLGHASYITGEVYKTPTGVALTARLGDDPPRVFEGPEASLDALEQQAAEAVYRNSQPYRFAQYLEQHGRVDEAFAVISDLAVNGPTSERGWAYAQWSAFDLSDRADLQAARAHARQAIAIGGDSTMDAQIAFVNEETWSGHDQTALDVAKAIQLRARRRTPGTTQGYFEQNRLVSVAWVASMAGDYRRSARRWMQAAEAEDFMGMARLAPALVATDFQLGHDPRAARAAMAPLGQPGDTSFLQAGATWGFFALPDYWAMAQSGDWPGALADARAADAWLAANQDARKMLGLVRRTWIMPLEALALARTGDAAGAEALIQTTPGDCYLCLRVRGQVAAEHHDWVAADRWFAEAARHGPELPFAYSDWGGMLLVKGDVDGAIAKLQLAHKNGPRFADPLELWGEALMRKDDFAGAVAKFKEADKNAPRWGRNHLRWGQALARLGKGDDAKAQYAAAAGMDLSAADRAQLMRLAAAPT